MGGITLIISRTEKEHKYVCISCDVTSVKIIALSKRFHNNGLSGIFSLKKFGEFILVVRSHVVCSTSKQINNINYVWTHFKMYEFIPNTVLISKIYEFINRSSYSVSFKSSHQIFQYFTIWSWWRHLILVVFTGYERDMQLIFI